ncbi:MAG: hypothetical protein WCE94_09585 [Candidatus Methanoperedens sp.]
MRVKLSKNGEEIASRSYRAPEPVVPNIDIRNAINCFRVELIPPNVVSAFISQNRNMQGSEYIARTANGDVWKIIVEIPLCRRCGREVNSFDDLVNGLCGNCRV